jgi:TonB family protein
MSFFLVAGAHVAVFAGLMLSINTTTINLPTPPFHATIIDKQRPHEELPKVPPPKSEITIHVAEPEFHAPPIDQNLGDPVIADSRPLPPTDIRTPPSPHVAKLEQGGTGAGFPDPAGFYPEQSIRLGDQGVSVVKVCVNTKGRLTGEPITARTSGFERLDQAAIRLAKAGSGHYRPSTEDGVPVESCYPVGVRFQIRN